MDKKYAIVKLTDDADKIWFPEGGVLKIYTEETLMHEVELMARTFVEQCVKQMDKCRADKYKTGANRKHLNDEIQRLTKAINDASIAMNDVSDIACVLLAVDDKYMIIEIKE